MLESLLLFQIIYHLPLACSNSACDTNNFHRFDLIGSAAAEVAVRRRVEAETLGAANDFAGGAEGVVRSELLTLFGAVNTTAYDFSCLYFRYRSGHPIIKDEE